MKDLVYAIQDFFLMILSPMDAFAKTELTNWWSANIINGLFVLVFFVLLGYWLKKLKIFNATDTERRDVVSHTFFK